MRDIRDIKPFQLTRHCIDAKELEQIRHAFDNIAFLLKCSSTEQQSETNINSKRDKLRYNMVMSNSACVSSFLQHELEKLTSSLPSIKQGPKNQIKQSVDFSYEHMIYGEIIFTHIHTLALLSSVKGRFSASGIG